ncbi:MAG: SDR family oxidoreductase [Candidatus Latescibacteria bacterium]|jgi:3-oxoacyl-[acyl-carrier protein] reductase|nr:SDR family oxidoreductase [Candidatus Latescibacterota bacterium]
MDKLNDSQKNTEQPLRGRVAWITGSSQGIGRAIANELARFGARVAVHGLREDASGYFGDESPKTMHQAASEIAGTYDTEAMSVVGDLTVESEVKRTADEIRAKWGQIDILVCCAGGDIGAKGPGPGEPGKPEVNDTLSVSLEDFHSVIDRNFMTTVLCCREVAPEMMTRKWGRIITMGSVAGTMGEKNMCAYRVAKASVHMYTRCLAAQLREYDIPVNCILPGLIASERWVEVYRTEETNMATGGTLDRVGQVEEVACVVGFLCTPGASYVSGQLIRLDGGWHRFAC